MLPATDNLSPSNWIHPQGRAWYASIHGEKWPFFVISKLNGFPISVWHISLSECE